MFIFRRSQSRIAWLIFGLIFVFLCFLASMSFGKAQTSLASLYTAFFAFDGSEEQVIIRDIRLMRALTGLLAGGCLGVAGAIMQAMTRNPLASPEILGINSGAALAVVVASFFWHADYGAQTWLAFTGAGAAGLLVFFFGSLGRTGITPMKLTLSGVAVTTLLTSFTQGVMVLNESTLDEMRFWLAGSLTGRDAEMFLHALPYMIAGLCGAMLIGKEMNTLGLGEDVAKELGVRTAWIKLAAIILIIFLAGGAVAAAGPIGFIGITVPHVVRFLVGSDYRWILPFSAVLGALFLLVSDIAARFVVSMQEIPVGVVTAIIGGPFFIYIARKRGKQG